MIVATTYWQSWAAPRLAAKQDNAIQRVAQFRDQARLHLRLRRQDDPRPNITREDGGQTLYLRTYPTNGLASQADRLLDAGPLARRDRDAENVYLTASNDEPRHVLRQARRHAEGHDDHREQPRAEHRRARPAGSPRRRWRGSAAPRSPRIRRRARSTSWRRRRASTRTRSSRRTATRASSTRRAPASRARVAAASTARPRASIRRARPSRRSRPRPRSTTGSTRRLDLLRPGLLHGVRQAVTNALDQNGPEALRRGQPRRGLPALDQRRLLQHRAEARRKTILDEAKKFGFYSHAADRASRPTASPRAASSTARRTSTIPNARTPDRPRPTRVRAGQRARDAAADGDGRPTVANGGTMMEPHSSRR